MRAISYAVCAFTLLTFCKPAFGSVITSAKDLAAAQAALARSASSSGDGKITICVVPGETSDSVANTTKPRRCRNYTRDADGKMVAAGDFYEKAPALETYEPSVWTATSRLASRLMDYVNNPVAGAPGDGLDRSSNDRTLTEIDALVTSVDAGRVKALGRARSEPSSGDLRRSVAIMTDVAGSVEQATSNSLTGTATSVLQQATLQSFAAAPVPPVSTTPATIQPVPTGPAAPVRAAVPTPVRPGNGNWSNELGGSGPR